MENHERAGGQLNVLKKQASCCLQRVAPGRTPCFLDIHGGPLFCRIIQCRAL